MLIFDSRIRSGTEKWGLGVEFGACRRQGELGEAQTGKSRVRPFTRHCPREDRAEERGCVWRV